MVGDAPTPLEAECTRRLQEFGFSEYEAYVFIYLTQLGEGTAKDVADMDHVPRSRVYDAAESLHDAGFVDVQYTTPRRFTPVSKETALRKLRLNQENSIAELSDLLSKLEPADRQSEEFGVWTVTGREAVASRLLEFIDNTDDEIIYMTVDDLLTDEHLDRLSAAADRGVSIYLAGISEDVEYRIQDRIPSATIFETLWEWSDAGAGSLLITDERTALVSVLLDGTQGTRPDETAIWGTGGRNSLVLVLRTIFTWRLNDSNLVQE
jgi:sugar-specific transcriptional regulator TrmB